MLALETPIIIHPQTFPYLAPVRIEIDLRTQTVTLSFGPAQVTADNVILGVQDYTKAEVQLRFPDLVRQVQLSNNMNMPDAAVMGVLMAFMAACEPIEQRLVETQHDQGGMATAPYQNGVTEWSLTSTFSPVGTRTLSLTPIGTKRDASVVRTQLPIQSLRPKDQ